MGKQDFSLDLYLKELLKDAADVLPKEKVEVLREVLSHDKVAPRVKDLHLMRSDYSRSMDEMKMRESALQQKLTETEQFYQSQILADHNNAQVFESMKSEVERLRGFVASGVDGGGGVADSTTQDSNKWVSRDDYNKSQKEFQEQALQLMAKSTFLATKHLKEFGEVLDVNEWYKHAMSKGLPLDVAYDSYTSGLREERSQKVHAKDVEEAREEGRREAMSKANIPLVDNRSRGIHAIRDSNQDVPRTHNDRVAAAVGAYMRGEESSNK